MSGIIPFDFETNAVRVVMIDDAPWFVAVDVCRVLEHSNIRQAISRWLDNDEKGVTSGDTLGGKQEMNIVSESGLYALILRSNTPAAKKFRKWVTAEVLPAIRRNGAYHAPSSDHAELEAKRAYYAALPDMSKARADGRAEALTQIEHLISDGMGVSAAIAKVADKVGLGKRTLYGYRRATYMVAQRDWGAAMAPRWHFPRGMLSECHPEALMHFVKLYLSGVGISESYRRLLDDAQVQGWQPIPHERTLRRYVERLRRPAAHRVTIHRLPIAREV